MDKNDVVSTLNDLIETCKDGEEGFRTCAEDISGAEMKSYFRDRASRCATSAAELQDLVEQYGGKPETTASVSGALHRRWVDIKALVTGKDDEAILNECERGEDVAKASYEKALAKDLPADVRSVVERQFQGVNTNHDQVKGMRNQVRHR
jgi:uncharacterized protein (TIGR02284 family)